MEQVKNIIATIVLAIPAYLEPIEGESKMGPSEYDAFVKEFKDYNKLVNDAVKEFADKEVEIEFEALSDDAFGKLMASNEWTMEQATAVGDFVCE